MNTSLSWIKMFVPDLDVTAQEYTDAMTLSGTKVEGYELLDADLENIVIGQIEKIEKHPDAPLKNWVPQEKCIRKLRNTESIFSRKMLPLVQARSKHWD